MPWEIQERDGKFCVINQETNETVHCHDTRAEAEAQLRALYANEPEAAGKTLLCRACSHPSETYIAFGENIRALDCLPGQSESNQLRVGAYGIRFGSPEERDLVGQWFAPDTDYGPHGGNGVVTMFNHGIAIDPSWRTIAERTFAPVRATRDDVGIFVETVLNLADEYERAIAELAQSGKLRWSSGTAAHVMRVDEMTGKILRWHPIEWSFTPTPAEPRLPPILPLKTWLSTAQTASHSVGKSDMPAGGAVPSAAMAQRGKIQIIQQEETMNEQLDALTQQVSALSNQMKGIQEAQKAINDILQRFVDEPALRNAGYVSDVGGKADAQIKSFADFLLAVQRHDDVRLQKIYNTKAMSGEAGSIGGYLVPTEFADKLLEVAKETAIVRPRAFRYPMQSRAVQIPALDQFSTPPSGGSAFLGGVVATWTEENAAMTETTPNFTLIELVAHELSGYTLTSRAIEQDSAISLQELLIRLFGQAIAWHEDYAFLRGNGVGKPLGVLNAPAAIAVTRASGGNALDYADVVNMLKRLPASSYPNAVWVLHQFLIADLLDLQKTNNTLVTFIGNLRDRVPGSLMGIPIVFTEKLPAPGTAGDVMLCDFSHYVIGDRQQIEIAYSEHYRFVNNQGTWRFCERIDGQPWVKGAITLADGTNTVSPFVYLA